MGETWKSGGGTVTVRLDVRDVVAGIDDLIREFPMAAQRALRRTTDQTKIAMARLIAADVGLPVGKVKDALRIGGGQGVATISATMKRIPLIEFGARGPDPSRGRGRGVSYRLPTGRGRLEHAFITTMPSGHRGVFMRSGPARLPIVEKHGPSLGRVFMNHIEEGQAKAREVLPKNIKSELRFALRRKAA